VCHFFKYKIESITIKLVKFETLISVSTNHLLWRLFQCLRNTTVI